MNLPPIFKNFETPKNVTEKNAKFGAKCLHCNTEIKGSARITSNFHTHMRKKHPEININTSCATVNQPKILDFGKSSGVQKYKPTDVIQKQSTDALIMFIAGDLLSLSTVESHHFKKFVSTLDPRFQIPSRKQLSTKLIDNKYQMIHDLLKTELQLAKYVSLTTDIWSNRTMKGYFGVTAHYISNWEMKSHMIACKRFIGRHTGDNIRHEFEEIISAFNLSNRIAYVTSDNASNMVKAFSFPLPGFKDSTIVDDGDDDDEHNNDDDDELISAENEDLKVEDLFPKHMRCYAHTLQLVVRDGLDDCNQNMKRIISKATKLVAHVRKSVYSSEILESEKRLQAANATRWNSQLRMLKSVLDVPEEKLNETDASVKLTSYERKLLSEICNILEPFETATLLVQKEKNVSGSMPIPVTVTLKNKLKDISCDYNSSLVNTLCKSLESRLSKYEEDDTYITASLLDPRFKVAWCDEEKIDLYVDGLKQKVHSCQIDEKESEESPPAKRARTETGGFFSFTPKRSRNLSGTSASYSEVDEYFREPCSDMEDNPLEYWKINTEKYPKLATLCEKYLSVPATLAPVERLFSIAGKVFRPDSSRLSDKVFEKLMFIKCNSDLC